ncbi:MAG: hypothetical protein JXB05_30220 [Myxococcaceae bacterium]|nr:hypothetical protein [Myxococcaceae bacterium]
MRRVLAVVVVLAVAFAALIAVLYMHDRRLGPFATGTNVKAFLGTTFEMSRQEVERTLGKRLLSCPDVKSLEGGSLPIPTFIWQCEAESVDLDLAAHEWSGFVPDLYVYETQAFGSFQFFDRRLTGVGVHFKPFGVNDGERLIRTVIEAVERSYGPCSREESDSVPGAYTLNCKKPKVNVALWINPSDERSPIVDLRLNYPALHIAFEEARAARDASAL